MSERKWISFLLNVGEKEKITYFSLASNQHFQNIIKKPKVFVNSIHHIIMNMVYSFKLLLELCCLYLYPCRLYISFRQTFTTVPKPLTIYTLNQLRPGISKSIRLSVCCHTTYWPIFIIFQISVINIKNVFGQQNFIRI